MASTICGLCGRYGRVDGVDGFETGKCKDIVTPSNVLPNNPTPTCKDTT